MRILIVLFFTVVKEMKLDNILEMFYLWYKVNFQQGLFIIVVVNVDEIVFEIDFEFVIRFILDYVRFGGKKRVGNYGFKIVLSLVLVGYIKCER